MSADDPSEYDPQEYEPEEYDPEADLPNPEEDLVSIPEAPSVEIPDPDHVPRYVSGYFWKTVLVVNYGLFAVCLAPMLAYFRGEYQTATVLFLTGVGAFGYAYFLYRRFRRAADAENGTEGPADESAADADADDADPDAADVD